MRKLKKKKKKCLTAGVFIYLILPDFSLLDLRQEASEQLLGKRSNQWAGKDN